jgi:hypothetical protein
LTRMAFAEQKKWVTVQQKTFTKWCVPLVVAGGNKLSTWLTGGCRLNAKIESRDLVVKDLVADLSDGVRQTFPARTRDAPPNTFVLRSSSCTC